PRPHTAHERVLCRPRAPPHFAEAPLRERLRGEKELLGLYLSDHPLADIAEQIGRYVTAYSGDLGEELDQQRVVVGGVVTGMRSVITKAKATMGVATLEDLQGSLEVIVFPKILEATAPTWRADAIVLGAGRVDHNGDRAGLLADALWDWDDAQAMGEVAFARAAAEGDRGRRGRNGAGNGNGAGGDGPPTARVPVGPGAPSPPVVTRTVPLLSPLPGC